MSSNKWKEIAQELLFSNVYRNLSWSYKPLKGFWTLLLKCWRGIMMILQVTNFPMTGWFLSNLDLSSPPSLSRTALLNLAQRVSALRQPFCNLHFLLFLLIAVREIAVLHLWRWMLWECVASLQRPLKVKLSLNKQLFSAGFCAGGVF